MTRFKLNSRVGGGIILFIMIVVILVPIWAVLVNEGIGEDVLRTNLVGFRADQPPTNPFPFLIVTIIAIGAFMIIFFRKGRKKLFE